MGEPQTEVEVGWLCETGEAGGTEGGRWSLCVCGGGGGNTLEPVRADQIVLLRWEKL